MFIRNVEFFVNPAGRDLIINDLNTQSFEVLSPDMYDFICSFLEQWKNVYPGSYQAAHKLHHKAHQGKYLMTEHILRCNFHLNDSTPDVDEDGNFHIENVPCPLKACNFCKNHNVICNPKLNTELTEREFEIGKLLAKGYSCAEIADQVFRSEHTIKGHKKNIHKKLGVNHSKDLVAIFYKRDWMKE